MRLAALTLLLTVIPSAFAYPTRQQRSEAEYYVAAYSRYYHVAVQLVRSIVQQESGWNPCVVSSKGAVGLMQLMPNTARILGVTDRCDIRQNIAAGVRYLAWLLQRFRGEVRLAVAAYYAGEFTIQKHGLNCRNPEVVAYVNQVRSIYGQMMSVGGTR